jgi:hypothetical protein
LPGLPQRGWLARLTERLLLRPAGALSAAFYRRRVAHNAQALLRLAAHAQPQLTSDHTLAHVTERLQTALEKLKADYHAGRLLPQVGPQPAVILTP